MILGVLLSAGVDKTMYIKWVVRKHGNVQASSIAFYDAYLVESYRDQAGIPRQRTIRYLGNIRQDGDSFPAVEREMFLMRSKETLQGMPDLSLADHHAILQQLHLKVPPLTWAEVQHGFYMNLHWYAQWCRQAHQPLPTAEEISRTWK